MSLIYQTSDNGPVLLVTIAQSGPRGGYCGHRILMQGGCAGQEMSWTKVWDTRAEAMQIMLSSPPIMTARRSGGAS